MGDENKSEMASSPGHREAMGAGELVPVFVPEVETSFILLEALNESIPILHNVFVFVAINVHTIFLLPILLPSQLA